jgi:RimJ/RimL family protein N-acetyltransferase
VIELARRALADNDLRRMIAHVAEGNVPSHQVLSKVGFTQAGVLRAHFMIRGRPTNEIVFGLPRDEFKTTNS